MACQNELIKIVVDILFGQVWSFGTDCQKITKLTFCKLKFQKKNLIYPDLAYYFYD